jgi:hypothetical protein
MKQAFETKSVIHMGMFCMISSAQFNPYATVKQNYRRRIEHVTYDSISILTFFPMRRAVDYYPPHGGASGIKSYKM